MALTVTNYTRKPTEDAHFEAVVWSGEQEDFEALYEWSDQRVSLSHDANGEAQLSVYDVTGGWVPCAVGQVVCKVQRHRHQGLGVEDLATVTANADAGMTFDLVSAADAALTSAPLPTEPTAGTETQDENKEGVENKDEAGTVETKPAANAAPAQPAPVKTVPAKVAPVKATSTK